MDIYKRKDGSTIITVKIKQIPNKPKHSIPNALAKSYVAFSKALLKDIYKTPHYLKTRINSITNLPNIMSHTKHNQ